MSLWPNVSYALDESFMDDNLVVFGDIIRERGEKWWRLATKFWLPILFFFTILKNLGHPLTFVACKAILFLVSTKPNPLSVLIFMRMSDYGSKMAVGDYKVLCVAKVELEEEQELTVVGILGGWWPLQTDPKLLMKSMLLQLKSLPLHCGIIYTEG